MEKKRMIIFASIIILFGIILGFLFQQKTFVEMPYQDEGPMEEEMGEALVDLNEIRGGGPPKGSIGETGILAKGIPALAEKNINFVSKLQKFSYVAYLVI
ncbi:MAG: hypothetical protein IIA83_10455 [Thaumarchaeota archaeon]|nr:hypothetical protein [Nitrososphaerota archaeon]